MNGYLRWVACVYDNILIVWWLQIFVIYVKLYKNIQLHILKTLSRKNCEIKYYSSFLLQLSEIDYTSAAKIYSSYIYIIYAIYMCVIGKFNYVHYLIIEKNIVSCIREISKILNQTRKYFWNVFRGRKCLELSLCYVYSIFINIRRVTLIVLNNLII